MALRIEPAYIGWSGAAQVLGIETAGVPAGEHGIDLPALERVVVQLARQGKTARLLYLASDYANPTGLTLPLAQRRQLLEAAERLDLLLVEDSAYKLLLLRQPAAAAAEKPAWRAGAVHRQLCQDRVSGPARRLPRG